MLLAPTIAYTQTWQVQSAEVSQPLRDSNVLTVKLSAEGGQHRVLHATLALPQVMEAFTNGNSAVVLGHAGNADMVAILDIAQQFRTIWFFCYDPTHLVQQFLAYKEWYPNHSTYTFNDVLLLYNLDRSMAANTIGAPLAPALYPFKVGLPIYPEWNASHRSCENITEMSFEPRTAIGPPIVSLSGGRLAFVQVTGNTAEGLTSSLVIVAYAQPPVTSGKISEFPLPIQKLPFHRTGAVLKVTGISELSAYKLKLDIPKWEYGVSEITVDITPAHERPPTF